MRQRSAVWKDLEEAEAATIRLLQLSQKTTQRLARSTTANNIDNDDDDDANAKDEESPLSLQECTEQFRETVSKIHTKLAPHSSLVKPYAAPRSINRMYQTRVELRLAREKRALLQEFLRLEGEEKKEQTARGVVVVVGGAGGGNHGSNNDRQHNGGGALTENGKRKQEEMMTS